MISARLDEYAAIVEGSAIVDTLARSDTDPVSAFDAAILSPLHKIRVPEGGRCYLVIDSLDEALMRVHRPTIFDVLSTRLDRLPSWLGIVASMRNNPGLLSQLSGMSTLRSERPRSTEPRGYSPIYPMPPRRAGLAGPGEDQHKINAGVENALLRSSAGNFLFVTTALDAVETGQLSFDQIEKLPPGLRSLYELFFHRLFRDPGVDLAITRTSWRPWRPLGNRSPGSRSPTPPDWMPKRNFPLSSRVWRRLYQLRVAMLSSTNRCLNG